MDVLGLDEMPMATITADSPPEEGFHPERMDTPTAAKEQAGQIDYQKMAQGFSCAMGHVWRARKKNRPAWFSAEHFGCPGAAFWLGFNKPQIQSVIGYVSSGIPNQREGEHYLATPQECAAVFEEADPETPPQSYMVVKSLELVAEDETPHCFTFFCRPEAMAGLHQLASYVTGQAEAVRSPFAPGCGSLWSWSKYYQRKGIKTAVLGGWDPSARKYYKTDEISFTVPPDMFEQMCQTWQNSFLTKHAWKISSAKIARSKKKWGEG